MRPQPVICQSLPYGDGGDGHAEHPLHLTITSASCTAIPISCRHRCSFRTPGAFYVPRFAPRGSEDEWPYPPSICAAPPPNPTTRAVLPRTRALPAPGAERTDMRIRRVASRFAIMLATAALVPLLAFGAWSLVTLQRATRESVVASNLSLAMREAEYISRNLEGAVSGLSLEGIRRTVEQIRIGSRGYALLVASDGRLIAHGNPDQRGLVARGERLEHHPMLDGGSAATWKEYLDPRGTTQLAVAARVPRFEWTLIIEQPTDEAFATATRLGWQLVFAASAALVTMVMIGVVLGRRFIAPISALEHATRQLAAGDVHTRATVSGADEFARLAAAFNAMADRLVKLQDAIKSQERQVMFGRVVAGLFHDLNHPIQNIGNNARLMLRDDVDAETRATLQASIDRELGTLGRLMDDVLNVARPRPLDRFPLDVNGSVKDVADAMRAESDRARVLMVVRCAAGPLVIDADRFALSRVYGNLLTNALQATPPGGRVTVSTALVGDLVEISVADTGDGIPPDRLAAIFDEFVTTRRGGLGLGLATSRRIVEQLGGSIAVVSAVGQGSTFTLRFPVSHAQAIEAAS